MLSLQRDQQSAALATKGDTIFKTLFQELPVGVLVMGAQAEIRFVNQIALNLLGLTESQLRDQTPLDPDWQVIQEDGTPFQLKLQSVPVRAKHALLLLATRQSLRNLVLGIYRPVTGDRVWLSVNTDPQLDADGCVEQVICTFSDITNLKAGEKLSKIHECFLTLTSDSDENIDRLTALAGDLLGGTWALYNRLSQGLLWSLGQWHTPPDFRSVDEPNNHICNTVIQNGSDQVFVVQDLQNTCYAQSNSYIVPHQLQTYVGQAVRCAGEYIGSLCVMYQNNFVPSEADKKLMGIIAAAIGVEEERKKEAIVWAQNEAKWRSLIHNSSNLITILEADGSIRYVSPAIQGILGCRPGELMGKNMFDFVHPDDVSSVKNDFQGVLQNPTTALSTEFRVRHKDGSWRYIESTYSNLLMDAPVSRIVVNTREVTERKLAEAALKQSEAQLREKADQLEQALLELQETQIQLIQTEKMSSLGQLVAGIAHEINNPVSFIYGNIPHATQYTQDLLHLVELYRRHYPNPVPEIQAEAEAIDLDFLSEDLPKLMDSMQIGAERIRQIVLSLRNFSRRDQAASERVDLHQGIDNTLLLLQHRLKAKAGHPEIQVIKEYGDLPLVECYAGQVNQVFMNILSNAIDALEEARSTRQEEQETDFSLKLRDASSCEAALRSRSPMLRIHTELQDGNTVVMRIADNGTGIPPHVQQQIFDPFFTTKSVGQGTGLGLSISYQIVVEKHGGQLKCFSTPGEGTEFWIELPVRLSPQ
jgi:PAS domain S-box-containing protein